VKGPTPHPYHHGDLANALVSEAVELARQGGPGAVVLREVARRAGVSATAAYRHFDSHEALLDAVAGRAYSELSQAMLAEMEALPRHRDPALAALARWRATGRGYVRFAVAQPGLFRTVFMRAKTTPPPPEHSATPSALLSAVLDECVRTGALPPERRQAMQNAVNALRAMPPGARERAIQSGRFSQYSPQEQEMLRGVSKLPLAPAETEQAPPQ